jgi:hypothetical protein
MGGRSSPGGLDFARGFGAGFCWSKNQKNWASAVDTKTMEAQAAPKRAARSLMGSLLPRRMGSE